MAEIKKVHNLMDGHPSNYGYYEQEDGIRLIELWYVLVRRKYTVLCSVVITTICALIYAISATPVYKTEAIVYPPSIKDLQAFNIKGINEASVDYVYGIFKRNLISKETVQLVFYETMQGEKTAEVQSKSYKTKLKDIKKGISISILDDKEVGKISKVALEYLQEDRELLKDFPVQVVNKTMEKTKDEIISLIKTNIEVRKKDLQQEIIMLRRKAKEERMDKIVRMENADKLEQKQINDKIKALRLTAEKKRMDRIEILKKAAAIAHELKIKDPIDYKLKRINAAFSGKSPIMTDISYNDAQLYKLGFEAIEAEIKSLNNVTSDDPFITDLRDLQAKLYLLQNNPEVQQLKKRSNDDPFIKKLRDKQIEITRLESIQIDPATVKTAQLLKEVDTEDKRIKPKRKRIVVIGFMLGLILGVIGVVIQLMSENQKKIEK